MCDNKILFLLHVSINKKYNSLKIKKGVLEYRDVLLRSRTGSYAAVEANSPGSDPAISKNLITKWATFTKQLLALSCKPKKTKKI